MANLTGGSTSGINFWDWNQWGFNSLSSTSDTLYEYDTPDGNTVQLIGSDFTYDKNGEPTGGTVEVVAIYDAFGNQIASLVLGSASLAELAENHFHNFWSVVLAGDDIIATGHQADTISGYAGNDYIFGGGGDDSIDGGEGNDIIDGDNGNDYISGGAGDDTIYFDPEEGNDIIDGGAGHDTVVHRGLNSDWPDFVFIEKAPANLGAEEGQYYNAYTRETTRESDPYSGTDDFKTKEGEPIRELTDVSLQVGSFFGTDDPDEPEQTEATLSSIEEIEVIGRDGGDQLYVENLTGTTLENGHIFFDGGAGDDDLHAASTTTDITYLWHWIEGEGNAGDGDLRFGLGAEDRFHFLDETDDGRHLTLGEGGDHVEIWEGISGAGISPDIQIWDAEYLDFDFGGGDNSFVVDFDLGGAYSGVLDVNFGDGTSLLDAGVHTGRIEAIGGNDHNAFFSGSGDDLLIGGASHDDIFGGGGADDIFGGAGDDDIGGGLGNDMLEGGEGADRFFFSEFEGTDTIVDFDATGAVHDVLDFTGYDGITEADLVIAQAGADTHITTPTGDTIILLDVAAVQLNNADFLF